MPELPEVEAARRLVETHVVGRVVTKAIVADDDKVVTGVEPRELEAALAGRALLSAERRGKHLWCPLGGAGTSAADAVQSLYLHFGMTGSLIIKGIGAAHYKSFSVDDSVWPPRFCKVELELEGGTRVAFTDSRRFARVRLLGPDPQASPPLSGLGAWDPLTAWPPLEEFEAAVRRQRRAIKALIMDQAFTPGVGNWVADESLYQARIHPEQTAHSLTPEQCAALHRWIQEVCVVAAGVNADADQFPASWLFHHRWGKGRVAAKVGGHAIDHITVGGRTSAYVPALQKLSKTAIAAAAATAAAGKPAAKKPRKGKAAAAAGEAEQEKGGEEEGAVEAAGAQPAAVRQAGSRGRGAAKAGPAPVVKKAAAGAAPARKKAAAKPAAKRAAPRPLPAAAPKRAAPARAAR